MNTDTYIINEILFRRRNAVSTPFTNASIIPMGSVHYTRAISLELAGYGYVMSKDLFDAVSHMPNYSIINFRQEILEIVKKHTGAHVKHKPLFTNFPHDVPEQFDYLMDRILGYISNYFPGAVAVSQPRFLSCGHVIDETVFDMRKFGACPVCQMQVNEEFDAHAREYMDEDIKLREIGHINSSETLGIFTNILSSKTAISPVDEQDIDNIIKLYGIYSLYSIPEEIPFKEVKALVAAKYAATEITPDILVEYVLKKYTATDVLRVAVAMCGGDVSLANSTKFKFKKLQRRMLLALIDNLKSETSASEDSVLEDMYRRREVWLRLAEALHPGDYSSKYKYAYSVFSFLRSCRKFPSFNSKADAAMVVIKNSEEFGIDDKIFDTALKHLSKRPGEFCRRLDFMLRSAPSRVNAIIQYLSGVVSRTQTPMLLQLWSHFTKRDSADGGYRAFVPKGKTFKMFAIQDERENIPSTVLDRVSTMLAAEICSRFKKLGSLPSMEISEDMYGMLVPFAQRSASKGVKTIARGSKIKFDTERTIRLFVYWKENGSRADIDLSAVFYGNEWDYVNHVSWTALANYGCTHSGDIQSAPHGASEFIDIDVNKLLSAGVRYVAMSVYSFTGQKFEDLEECFAGYMLRNKPNSGEIFEPSTVQHKFDITNSARTVVPMFVDLLTGELVWCDIPMLQVSGSNNLRSLNTVEGTVNSLAGMCQTISDVAKTRLTLGELFEFHSKSRETDSTAPVITVGLDGDIKPFDTDIIISKFM